MANTNKTPEAAQPSGTDSKERKNVLQYLMPAVTVLTPVFLGIITIYGEAARKELNSNQHELEIKIRQLDESRKNRESIQGFTLKVLNEIKEALQSKDPVHQEIIIGLLKSMPNQDLSHEWLQSFVISKNTSNDTKKKAEVALNYLAYNRVEQAKAPATSEAVKEAGTPEDWKGYNYDIFWCEESPSSAKEEARAIVEKLAQQGAIGRLRLRVLPTDINERAGYNISGYQIRSNSGEEEAAKALTKTANLALGSTITFQTRKISQPSHNYISAFVCPK